MKAADKDDETVSVMNPSGNVSVFEHLLIYKGKGFLSFHLILRMTRFVRAGQDRLCWAGRW